MPTSTLSKLELDNTTYLYKIYLMPTNEQLKIYFKDAWDDVLEEMAHSQKLFPNGPEDGYAEKAEAYTKTSSGFSVEQKS